MKLFEEIDIKDIPKTHRGKPVKQLRKLRQQGLTYRQISEISGIAHTTVYEWINGLTQKRKDTRRKTRKWKQRTKEKLQKRKEQLKKRQIHRNIEIINSELQNRKTLHYSKRIKYAIYRLYRYHDLTPREISIVTNIKCNAVQKLISRTFVRECSKINCVLLPYTKR